MQLLTKESDYAVRALLYIAASKNGTATAAEIASKESISWLFLRRLMQQLSKKGLLRSQKGRTGGFRLGRPASRISLADVMQVFQGKIVLSYCVVRGRPCCNRPHCPVRKRIKELERVLRKELYAITVSMLVQQRRKDESR